MNVSRRYYACMLRPRPEKMNFSVQANQHGYRVGCIEDSLGNKFETPLCVLYTKSGSAPYLSQDVLKKADLNSSVIMHMPVNHFCDHQQTLSKFGKGLEHFTANQGTPVFCSVQDPAVPVPTGYNDLKGVALWGKSGKFKMNCDEYMSLIETCRPNWFQALCDSDTDQSSSKKRIKKSVERTLDYLDRCIERRNASEKLKDSKLLGVIEGGYELPDRIYSATETAKRDVDGFMIEGFHNLGPAMESFQLSSVQEILTSVITLLPDKKLRAMFGIQTPKQILEAYKMGIDVFNSCYPFLATECGAALNYNLNLDDDDGGIRETVEENESVLFLKDKKYFRDFGPILKDCTCLTCKQHSRAYINHLLVTSELLGNILLMIHNFHHFMEFFKVLRLAAKDNLLTELENILASRNVPQLHLKTSLGGGDTKISDGDAKMCSD